MGEWPIETFLVILFGVGLAFAASVLRRRLDIVVDFGYCDLVVRLVVSPICKGFCLSSIEPYSRNRMS